MIKIAAEKKFENKIKKFLKDNDAWFVKYFANRMTKSGIPDILACVNGYFVAVEVKAENGKPSELQKYHRDKINESMGIAVILYPQDYHLFQQLVKSLNAGDTLFAWHLVNQINERSL